MLITFEDVSLGFDGHSVVRNLSFSIEHGDYLWLVGENGSGKTTVVKGILRLLNPLEGRIVFCNELKQGRIGYLSQQMALKKDFPAGVYEIVMSGNLGGMGLRPFYNAKEKTLAAEAMKQLGIMDLKGKCFRELSGGQQRRVLLARALCAALTEPVSKGAEHKAIETSCRLLILDEPAASLDPIVTTEVYELLNSLNRKMGITIIMVSHDTLAAGQYANKILHLEGGMGYFGETSEYLNSERGKKFFRHNEEKDNG
ncbi:MAG: metal ABC transporter ATP-binding protein [Treponema sp.]|nr:metal ABC transporter ATP-binding protein [Treponema sp.]MCL2130784.1 metal ABC transporter ATP-binding protein [Treponema sp.]